jgi:fibronectin type 3 domain-containing protein
VQSLRIRRSATQWIYCDLRSSGGPFEAFGAGSPATQGVMLRLGPAYTTRTQPQLLDATPATTSFGDAALLPGQSFDDPLSGVRITVDAVTGGTATVRVQFATPSDVTPPTLPGSLSASLVGGSVQLVWGAASDDVGVTGYRVYRDGTLIAVVTATGWSDPAPPAGTQVAYAVAAIDAAGNEGARRAVLVSTAPPPPDVPTGLSARAEAGGRVQLSWAGAARALRYVVTRDGSEVAQVDGTTATDTGLRAGSTYAYAVVAMDASGRRGAASGTVLVTVPTDVIDGGRRADVRAPSAPGRLTVRTLARQRVRLAWRPARDDVRVAHYRVSLNGRVVLRTRQTAATLRLGKARRTVTVRAVDAAGNVGRPIRLVLRARG